MKRILAISLALIIGLSLSAQIQNKILGFTLGETTKSEVYNKYKSQELFTELDGDIAVGNLKFAGQVWDVTLFRFYNDKLMVVQFSVSESTTPLTILESLWVDFKYKLENKYSDYYINSLTDFILFSDFKTDLSLSFFDVNGMGLNLSYSDCALREQYKQAEEDEL